jgi:hypothetical protein
MGGHVREVRIGTLVCAPGVDYNLCSDPEASIAVLGAGFRTTLVTADVTLSTWMNRRDLALARPALDALAAQIEMGARATLIHRWAGRSRGQRRVPPRSADGVIVSLRSASSGCASRPRSRMACCARTSCRSRRRSVRRCGWRRR